MVGYHLADHLLEQANRDLVDAQLAREH